MAASVNATLRVIRRKISSLSEVKLAVLGYKFVGKSALAVRFLTKRYIGEYDHKSESRYRSEILVDGEPVIFEIWDTCPKEDEPGELARDEIIGWADGFVLVYSTTDRDSFNHVQTLRTHVAETRKRILQQATMAAAASGGGGGARPKYSANQQQQAATKQHPPMIVIGAKSDLVHLRQVSTEEGEILSKDVDSCAFVELSAAEQVTQVADAFCDLCREVLRSRSGGGRGAGGGNKQSLLDRMLTINRSSKNKS